MHGLFIKELPLFLCFSFFMILKKVWCDIQAKLLEFEAIQEESCQGRRRKTLELKEREKKGRNSVDLPGFFSPKNK